MWCQKKEGLKKQCAAYGVGVVSWVGGYLNYLLIDIRS